MALTGDRVKETSTSTGTGGMTLAGAVSQYQSFATAFGTGWNMVEYAIVGQGTTEWETGFGQYDANLGILHRTYPQQGSGGAGVNVTFSAGTKDVFATYLSGHANNQTTVPPIDTSAQATTLSGNGGSITNVATTMLVTSSAGFPATPFMCIVGTEEMKVTNVSSLTWTVTRAYNGTSGASHNDGVTVTQENWQWVNQGTASTTQNTDGSIFLNSGASTTLNMRIRKRLIGSNTSVRAAFLPFLASNAVTKAALQIIARESATGKIATVGVIQAAGIQIICQRYASPTSATATDTIVYSAVPLAPAFFRMDPTGTNVLSYSSSDGQNWLQVGTVAKTTAFTTAPDEWGYAVIQQNNTAADPNAGATLVSWKEQ